MEWFETLCLKEAIDDFLKQMVYYICMTQLRYSHERLSGSSMHVKFIVLAVLRLVLKFTDHYADYAGYPFLIYVGLSNDYPWTGTTSSGSR